MYPNSINNSASVVPGVTPEESARYYTGIDWAAILFRLLENIHWIMLAAVFSAAAVGLFLRTAVTPIYQATSKIYIAGSETTVSLSDLQLGSSLAIDYQEAFKIWHVHEMVDQRLGLDYSYSKLASMVSVSNPSGSHLLYISIKSPSPDEAKLLADTYAEVVQLFIAEKMELRRPQLVQIAQKPSSPISPNIQSSVIRGFLFGGLAAAAIVILLYLLDDKIRTAEDVEKASGLSTFGILTKQSPKNENDVLPNTQSAEDDEHTAVIRSDLSLDYAGDESINTICSAIMFTGTSMKRIAVTSHEANNGKTFIALRIARSLAERGQKVLLIDADLRKSVLIRKYRISHVSKGLAHYLSGQCSLNEAIYATNYPGLFLMPSGPAVKTPLPLLTSVEFEQLMDLAKNEFDMVIVDTPPIGIVIDAAEIAKRCDGSLLVLDYNKQTRGALRYMQKTMAQTGTLIIGCVINNVVMKKLFHNKSYYYQYGYHQYGYQYYSADDHEKHGKHKNKKVAGRKKK